MLDVKKMFTKILTSIKGLQSAIAPTNMFAVDVHQTAEITTSANNNRESTHTCTKSGYYPIGIVGYHVGWVAGSTAHINIFQLCLTSRSNGSCTVSYALRNTYSAQTKYKLNFYVLWMKI